MTLTKSTDAVRHETPNAVMRTLAAPSTGARELAVWEVTMRAGQAGPVHIVDREQVWVVLDGELRFALGDGETAAHAGDAVTIAAGAQRRVNAPADARAVVSSPAAPQVSTADAGSRPLPWAV